MTFLQSTTSLEKKLELWLSRTLTIELSIFDSSGHLLQGVPKKMSFSGKTAITTFKLIQNAKVGGVLESSGYLLQHGH